MKDYPQDFPHENGNYSNKCNSCESEFLGNKRRFFCAECRYKKAEAQTKQARADWFLAEEPKDEVHYYRWSRAEYLYEALKSTAPVWRSHIVTKAQEAHRELMRIKYPDLNYRK